MIFAGRIPDAFTAQRCFRPTMSLWRSAKRAEREESWDLSRAFLRATPLPGQTWFSVYWEPLWAELEETGMTVGFHECTNSGHYPHLERFGIGNRLLRHVCTHVTGQMVTMVDMILGGVLERFPAAESRVSGMQLRLGAVMAPAHGPPLGAAGQK